MSDKKLNSFLHFINTLENEETIILFLGAGASMEGYQNESSFPSFNTIIGRILNDYNENKGSEQEKIDAFLKIIEQWTEEGSVEDKFASLLEGEPGVAHYYLASLIWSASAATTPKNLNLILTTNFDNLIDFAINEIKVGALSESISQYHNGDFAKRFLEQLFNRSRNGTPVVIKLFGDTVYNYPIFHQSRMNFDSAVKDTIKDWLKKPVLFIGYSFSDNLILNLLAASDGRKPIFVVDPAANLKGLDIRHNRIHHICEKFYPFIQKTIDTLKEKESPLITEFDSLISKIDPRKLYKTVEHIRIKAEKASQFVIKKVESQLKIGNKYIIPIERDGMKAKWEKYINSDARCFALIGQSGIGKTTLLYNLVKEQNEKIICLFYNTFDLKLGSLKETLADDFCSDTKNIEELFRHFGMLLKRENCTFLIIIDAINEEGIISLGKYKGMIEKFAMILPLNIKLIYSCKESSWIKLDHNISMIPDGLYLNNIYYYMNNSYSDQEVFLTFLSYQRTFGFIADYNLLNDDIKKHMADPYLMRIIASVYRKNKLPNSIQINKLFEFYHNELLDKLCSSNLELFLEAIIIEQLKDFFLENKSLSNVIDTVGLSRNRDIRDYLKIQLSDDIKPGNPFQILADEGVIIANDKRGRCYSFFHDRYHELLLSQYINQFFEISDNRSYINCLKSTLQKIGNTDTSIYNALILFATQYGSKKPESSFINKLFLSDFIISGNPTTYYFAVDVIRTILNESKIELNKLVTLLSEFDKFVLFDVLQNDPKELLIQGLLSHDRVIIRRCVQTINKYSDKKLLFFVSSELINLLKNKDELEVNEVSAIVYLSACFIFKASLSEAFEPLMQFWSDIFPKGISFKIKKLLVKVLEQVANDELVHFFPTLYIKKSFDYLWCELTPALKQEVLYILKFLKSEESLKDKELLKIVRFFGSELKHSFNPTCEEEYFTYKIEYKLAKWLLIKRSKNHYSEVKDILEQLVKTNFWLTIDFCLCVMKYILQQVHYDNKTILADAYSVMQNWTNYFELTNPNFFYALSLEEPFKSHFNSLGQVSKIGAQFFREEDGSIKFLRERLKESSDLRIVKMATLSLRQLWRDHCDPVLSTLEYAFRHPDEEVKKWIDDTLSEIYLIHPTKVNIFLEKMNCGLCRINKIKYNDKIKEISGVEYYGETLYSKIFLSNPKKIDSFVEIYKHLIFKCKSINDFFNYFLDIFDEELIKRT